MGKIYSDQLRKVEKIKPFGHSRAPKENATFWPFSPSWGNWPIWKQHLSKKELPLFVCFLHASFHRHRAGQGRSFYVMFHFHFRKLKTIFCFQRWCLVSFQGLFKEVGVLSELLLRSGFHSSRSAALVKTLNQINRPIDRWWIPQIWRPSIRLASEVST